MTEQYSINVVMGMSDEAAPVATIDIKYSGIVFTLEDVEIAARKAGVVLADALAQQLNKGCND